MLSPDIRVLVADDHLLFNDAICELLKARGFSVHQVFKPADLLFTLHKERPAVLLLDVNFREANGIDLAIEVKKNFSAIKIVMVTMYKENRILKAVRQIPLEGYVLKDSPFQILISAIESIMKGKQYYDPALSNLGQGVSDHFSDNLNLTLRERQIVRQLVSGKKAGLIAEELGLGYQTIKHHRKNIYEKLHISSLAELISFAHSHHPDWLNPTS